MEIDEWDWFFFIQAILVNINDIIQCLMIDFWEQAIKNIK